MILINKIKDFRNGITNLIRYFNVIWNNCEWDQEPLYSLLRFKLKMMLKSNIEARQFAEVEDVIEQLTECVELLDKIIQDKYEEDFGFNEYVEKYGLYDFEDETEKTEEELELQDQKHDEIKKIFNNAYTSKMNDIKQLFDIMAKYSEKWWN